jgi:hypothetical protein
MPHSAHLQHGHDKDQAGVLGLKAADQAVGPVNEISTSNSSGTTLNRVR